MFAVIFKAKTAHQDQQYQDMVQRMRELAFNKYGCLDFVAVTQDDQEVAISYWQSEEDILAWRQDPEHLAAQQLGRVRFYSEYQVEVVEIKRQYSHSR